MERHLYDKSNNKITEQSYKGKVKTHNYINRQNQSTTETVKAVMTLTCEAEFVLFKRQVWMPIFQIINIRKKNRGHRGPGFLMKN